MEVYVDKHHIRGRPLYVMPLASTFLDEESMDGCIRKARGYGAMGKRGRWGFTIK
jgi:hypothetical protein